MIYHVTAMRWSWPIHKLPVLHARQPGQWSQYRFRTHTVNIYDVATSFASDLRAAGVLGWRCKKYGRSPRYATMAIPAGFTYFKENTVQKASLGFSWESEIGFL